MEKELKAPVERGRENWKRRLLPKKTLLIRYTSNVTGER